MSHNAICFKYNLVATQKCQFNFSHLMIEQTHILDVESIEICHNNGLVNSWNAAFALLIQSNHNIIFILSVIKALALAKYIINYATKSDCDQY